MEDISGKKFGEYTVETFAYPKGRHYYWNCLCSCGAYVDVRMDKLKAGTSTRCRKCGTRSKTTKATTIGEWSKPKKEIVRELAVLGWKYLEGIYVRSSSRLKVECVECGKEKNLLWEHRNRSPCRSCGEHFAEGLTLKEEPWSSKFKDCSKVRREFSVWRSGIKVASGCVFLDDMKKGVVYKVVPDSYYEVVKDKLTHKQQRKPSRQ